MSDNAQLIECLSDIVALSYNDCECFVNDRPDDYNVGCVEITDVEFGIPFNLATIKTKMFCAGKNIWELLQYAKERATDKFINDLRTAIYHKYDTALNTFNGWIGKKKKAKSLSSVKRFVGQCYKPAKIKGGCIVIDKVAIGLTCKAEVKLLIYSNQSSEPIHTEQLNALGGVFHITQLANPIELPFYKEDCEDLKYYFVYEVPENCKPLQNKITCCGQSKDYQDYLHIKGFETDDLSSISASSNYGYGLSINICIQCKTLDWLCETKTFGVYNSKELIARTIAMKAAVICFSSLIADNRVNHFNCTIPDLENMRTQRQAWYTSNLEYIADNLPNKVCDCLKCKSSAKIKRKPIRT